MSESVNRRQFLGAAASTGLALGLAGKAGLNAAGAGDKIVVAIMGTGGGGTEHARPYEKQSGVEVAYVCDVDQGGAGKAADAVAKIKGHTPKAVLDYRRILD